MLETDTLLVKCPNCGAWPMAANPPKNLLPGVELEFRCSRCAQHELGRLRRPSLSGAAERVT